MSLQDCPRHVATHTGFEIRPWTLKTCICLAFYRNTRWPPGRPAGQATRQARSRRPLGQHGPPKCRAMGRVGGTHYEAPATKQHTRDLRTVTVGPRLWVPSPGQRERGAVSNSTSGLGGATSPGPGLGVATAPWGRRDSAE